MGDSDLLISLEDAETPKKQEFEPAMTESGSNQNLLDQPLEILDPFAMSNSIEVLKPTVLIESTEEASGFEEPPPKISVVAEMNPRLSTASATPSDIGKSTTMSNRKSTSSRSMNMNRSATTIKHAPTSARLNPTPPQVLPIHFNLPTRKWVDASTFCDIPVVDKLSETIAKAFSHQPSNQRPQKTVLTLSKALESPDAYATLIAANSWRNVAQLARNDLIACHPTEVDEIMRLWFLRWTALLKLKLYDIILEESERLKVSEMQDLSYSSFPEVFPEYSGTMLTFDILVLLAKIPSFKGNHNESIHKLYRILYPQKAWDFRPDKIEHYRILLHVISVLLLIPDLPLAISLTETIALEFPDNVDMLAMLGRLQLQVGDIENAFERFQKVEYLLGLPPSKISEFSRLPNNLERPDLVLSNRAFTLFALDKFTEAAGYLTDLVTLYPDSMSVMNNLAICHLYSGNVGQGSSFLESFMVTHPTLGGSRPELIFNLSSMFDLADSSIAKKRALLKVIIHGCGDNFEGEAMKI